MPTWVKVSTYLLLLVATVYLYLAPRFVTGQIVARTPAGGYVPYRGVSIQTHVAGHTLKFTTDEDGYWTIPIVDRKPGEVTLQVYHEDDHSCSLFPLVHRSLDRKFSCCCIRAKPFVSLEVVAITSLKQVVDKSFSEDFCRPAQAAELTYSKHQSIEQTPEVEQAFRTQVLEDVRDVVLDVTKLSLAELNELTSLEREQGLGYVQKIQVIEKLEAAYKIKIPDEHWRQFRNIGGLATYIADRKDLEKGSQLAAKYLEHFKLGPDPAIRS